VSLDQGLEMTQTMQEHNQASLQNLIPQVIVHLQTAQEHQETDSETTQTTQSLHRHRQIIPANPTMQEHPTDGFGNDTDDEGGPESSNGIEVDSDNETVNRDGFGDDTDDEGTSTEGFGDDTDDEGTSRDDFGDELESNRKQFKRGRS